MLDQIFVSHISSEVANVRRNKGIDMRSLADSSDVGIRFISNLEKGTVMQWKRIEQIRKLLRVLNALSLSDTAESVKKEIKKVGRRVRRRRMKFDKRFKFVLSKKGCRFR